MQDSKCASRILRINRSGCSSKGEVAAGQAFAVVRERMCAMFWAKMKTAVLVVLAVAGMCGGVFAGVQLNGAASDPGKQRNPDQAAQSESVERVYSAEQLFRVQYSPVYSEFVWVGPRLSTYNYKFEGLAVDLEGNVYGAVKGQVGRGATEGNVAYECVIMKYDPKTERLTRLAGGARGGSLDGPGEIAQFNYQFYSGGGLRIDKKRGYLYLADFVHRTIRRINIKDGYVTTVAPEIKPAVSVAVDQEGKVYIHVPGGDKRGLYCLTPEGTPGAETYKVERVGEKADGGWIVADAKRGKVYSVGRGDDSNTIQVWDLKAGAGGVVKPAPIATPSGAHKGDMVRECWKSDGPVADGRFYCPANLNISPDGRYLHFGGGDEYTYRRIDVDQRRTMSLWKLPDGHYTWKARTENQSLFAWPSACCETEDGIFYIGSSEHGLHRLTPVAVKQEAGK